MSGEGSSENLVEVGYITRPHGVKGEVQVRVYDGESEFLSVGEVLFLEGEGFRILSRKGSLLSIILKLEGVDSRTDSEILKGKKISIFEGLLKKYKKQDEIYLRELLGFRVFFSGEIKGEVIGFASTPAHDMLEIELSGDAGQVELPYVSNFIKNIDYLKKKIEVDCPEEFFESSFFKTAKNQGER